VILGIGIDSAAGLVSGIYCDAGVIGSLEQVAIVDARMPIVPFQSMDGAPPKSGNDGLIWSRTIGALGDSVWRRMTALRFAIVGCGRSGSLMAQALARFGVRALAMIDPDRLETHNLGEMECVSTTDIGQNKALAVARSLQRYSNVPRSDVVAIPESVFSLSSLGALKLSDMVVCCTDNPASRIATDFIAKLYLKPLLDVGTGVLPGQSGNRIGADIRFVLPERCLLCVGGVAGLGHAREELFLELEAGSRRPTPNWQQQRAGSLRSLNQIATGYGLRLLEEFMQGRLQSSAWLQLDTNDTGLPVVIHAVPPVRDSCALCSVGGQGDSGIDLLRTVLESDRQRLL